VRQWIFLEKLDDAIGIDLSKVRVKRAKERSGKPVVVCAAETLPFKDQTFDYIIISGVL